MLSSVTSKSAISSSPQSAILAGNTATKSSSVHGPSSSSVQFDDEFHSALQDRATSNPADSSKASAPATPLTTAQQPAMATNLTRDVQQSTVPTVATQTNVPSVPATKAADDNDEAAQAALSAALSKDVSVASQITVATNKAPANDNLTESSKDKKAKKADSDTSAETTDASSAASMFGLPVITAPVPPSPAADDSTTPVKNSDNSQGGQTFTTPVPQQMPTGAKATPSLSAADTPSAGSTSKESEAFSMLLTPQSATPPQQNVAKDAPATPPPASDAPAANQATASAKAAANVVPMADGNAPIQSAQTKTVTSSATNSGSGTPSSLGQDSDATTRSAKPEDKEQAVASTAGANDATGNKQDFSGFGAAPEAFGRDTKVSGPAVPSAPTTPTADTQDSAPAATGSAKEVAIRLEGQSGQTINVKLVDQGGQVQVSVRSNDPATATALRGDLSSLASNLDKAGWKPEITTAAGTSSMETVSQTRQSDRNSQDSQSSRQPDWQQQGTPKKRPSVSDLWDQLLTTQNT